MKFGFTKQNNEKVCNLILENNNIKSAISDVGNFILSNKNLYERTDTFYIRGGQIDKIIDREDSRGYYYDFKSRKEKYLNATVYYHDFASYVLDAIKYRTIYDTLYGVCKEDFFRFDDVDNLYIHTFEVYLKYFLYEYIKKYSSLNKVSLPMSYESAKKVVTSLEREISNKSLTPPDMLRILAKEDFEFNLHVNIECFYKFKKSYNFRRVDAEQYEKTYFIKKKVFYIAKNGERKGKCVNAATYKNKVRKVECYPSDIRYAEKGFLKNLEVTFDESQYAYIKGRSSLDIIEKDEVEFSSAKFDLKNAFNTIKNGDIYNLYRFLGFSKNDSYYISKVLTNNSGELFQGGVFSPLIYNVFQLPTLIKLKDKLSSTGYHVACYADDILIYTFKNRDSRIYKILRVSIECFEDFGWTINPNKTKIMSHFNKQDFAGVCLTLKDGKWIKRATSKKALNNKQRLYNYILDKDVESDSIMNSIKIKNDATSRFLRDASLNQRRVGATKRYKKETYENNV